MERLWQIRRNYFNLIISIVISLTTILIFLLMVVNITKLILNDTIKDFTLNNIRVYARLINNWQNKNFAIMKMYADNYDLDFERAKDLTLLNKIENSMGGSVESLDYIFVSDENGHVISSRVKLNDLSKFNFFNKIIKRENVITAEKLDGNTFSIIMAIPIYDDKGIFKGVFGVVLKKDVFQNLISYLKINDANSYSYLIDENGLALSHPNKDFILRENILNTNHPINLENPNNGYKVLSEDSGFIEYEYMGIDTYAYFSKIDNKNNWRLVTRVPKEYISKQILNRTHYIFFTALMLIIFISIVSYYVVFNISQRIITLNYEIKEKQEKLKQTLELEKHKSEFLANVSHEFKTPVNIIFSSCQLMENTIKNDEIDKEKMMRYLKMIKQNSYRLMRLINNLLDITKLDLGFYELNLVNVNAVELIEDIVMSVADYANSKNREVIFDTNVEEKFMALDADKVERIILNLMSNSIKFTDEGDKIYVNFEDKEDYIEVKVKDTGIGIPEDKLNVIFDKFRQAQTLFRREHEGSGIGLYLVKQLVELHGGEISVSSTLGEGTEFVVKFPVRIIESNNENFSYSISNKIEKINIEFSDIYD